MRISLVNLLNLFRHLKYTDNQIISNEPDAKADYLPDTHNNSIEST